MHYRSLGILVIATLAALGCREPNPTLDGGPTPGTDTGPTVMPDASNCTVVPENTAALCTDGQDNDCDTNTDCNDFDCCSVATCGPDTACGRRGDAGPPGMACEGPSAPENTLEACSDGCSNDHADNTFVDCNDFGCCGVRTDCPSDTTCGMGTQSCEGDPTPERSLAQCTDGCSNDVDEGRVFADCEELDCCPIRIEAASRGIEEACPADSACGMRTQSVTFCADDDITMPPVPENSYERCSDGCASDRDRFFDCDDFKCCAILVRAVEAGVAGAEACMAGTACADSFMPREGVVLCDGDDSTGDPPAEDTLEACTNSCDDDRDGFQDCQDRSCCDVLTDCAAGTFCGDN